MISEKRKKDNVKNVQSWRIRTKQKMVELKGGCCEICGYNKCNRALVFHHLDPNEKDFGFSTKGITRSWNLIEEELKKCVLLCSNCHMEVHDGLIELSN